ncbi:carbon-nitrogen hydrolase family protein [Streptomyces sp. MNP-20]|uniref:carbon-nitrogen hydrolase family protein n=1 Tax=Streptomyces sp. MNP-20 TaxID=2721165 RepID=UPI001552D97C|nr:carbon-nitrogen hydrolase family protein [Streptomyces sp. MNP-20]
MSAVTIAVVQMESKLGRHTANMRRAERHIAEAVGRGATLVCLPEAFLTSGNILEVADVAVPIPGPETDRLGKLAQDANIHLVAGLLERGDDGKYYSTSILFGPDGTLVGRYRRVHCHELESRYLSSGSDYPVFDVEFGRVGLLQGYDINFPEAAREYYRRGVDMLVCSALVPEMFGYVANLRLLARAVDTECVIAFASGIGTNLYAGFGYMGCSQVVADPLFLEAEQFDFVDGDERMVFLESGEGVGVVEVDMERMRRYRKSATLRADLQPATYGRSFEVAGAPHAGERK